MEDKAGWEFRVPSATRSVDLRTKGKILWNSLKNVTVQKEFIAQLCSDYLPIGGLVNGFLCREMEHILRTLIMLSSSTISK